MGSMAATSDGLGRPFQRNPIPPASSSDQTNPTSPAPPSLEALLEDLTRRAEALSAAGFPVRIPG
jgi:hypothetical protein